MMMVDASMINILGQKNAIISKWKDYVLHTEQLIENDDLFSKFIIDCNYFFYSDENANKDLFTALSSTLSSNTFSTQELIKKIQAKPTLLANTIEKIELNFILKNQDFFEKLILHSLSSKYKITEDEVATEERIEALIKIRNKLHGINNEEFNFKSIINRIIYEDYCCGLDVCAIKLNSNKLINKISIAKDQDEKEEINDTGKDFEKISNIILSNMYYTDANDTCREINNNNVLAFFQNRYNNKLYFSANIKTDYNDKTWAQLIVDNFLDYLEPASVERILSTFGLYSEEVQANNIIQGNLRYYNMYAADIQQAQYDNVSDRQKKLNQENFNKNIMQTVNDIPDANKITFAIDDRNKTEFSISQVIDGKKSKITDTRYANYEQNKEMIEKIIKSNAFKKIKIDNYVPYCSKLKTNFSKINPDAIEKKQLSDVFFENFQTQDLDVLSNILNMESFADLKTEQIEKIWFSFSKIRYEQDKPYSSDYIDNNKEMSTIIECAKKLYFHKNATNNLKQQIIQNITNIISNIDYNNDKKMYSVGNSLIQDSENETRYDNKIAIKDYEFLEKIIERAQTIVNRNEKLQESFAHVFSSAINNIESARVFLLLAKTNFFTKRKIVTESLTILNKQEQNLIKLWGIQQEEFLQNTLEYAGIKCKINSHEQKLRLLSDIGKQKYDFSISVGKRASKKIIDAAILMKDLADGLRYIDFNNSYSELADTIKKSNILYSKINKSGDINWNEEDELFKITAYLQKNVEKQFTCAEKIINQRILDSKNNHTLTTMSEEIKQTIKFINEQITKNYAYDDIPDSNGKITKKLFELEEHFKTLRDAYNRFISYDNKRIKIDEYKKQQKNNILNAKNTLINSLKSMMIKKQKEWNEIFTLNKNKQNSKLKEFYNEEYSNIDNFATQILNAISEYEGTDVENMQNQAKKNIEKLETKILNFDKNIKNAIKITNNYNEDLFKNSKQNSNINNSIIRKTNKHENEIKKSQNKLIDTCDKKNEQALSNIDVKKNKIFFDKKQLMLFATLTFNIAGVIIATALTGNPIFLAAGSIAGTGLNATIRNRINNNNKKNDVYKAKSLYCIYDKMFEKDDKKDIKNDEQNTDNEEKEILKKVDVNLDDNKKQPVLK